jgi:hypothetical protein
MIKFKKIFKLLSLITVSILYIIIYFSSVFVFHKNNFNNKETRIH